MEKPQRPLGRLVRECDNMSLPLFVDGKWIDGNSSKFCPFCQSSLKRKLVFFRTKRCIHPECSNYYGRA